MVAELPGLAVDVEVETLAGVALGPPPGRVDDVHLQLERLHLQAVLALLGHGDHGLVLDLFKKREIKITN